jgi:deoxyuridine 5'-triphosphate nucleotidohydrolase
MVPEYNKDSMHYIAGMLANKELSSNYLLDFDLADNTLDYSNIIEKCDPYYFKIFMKGYLDSIKNRLNLDELKLYLSTYNRTLVNYPYHECEDYIILTGVNIIDFVGEIYPIKHLTELFPVVHCRFVKANPAAVTPSKTRLSDAGYDLTVISKYKKLNSVTTLYDTGIRVSIEPCFYVEVVPRSSLSKSGYMLANSMGIIDQSYRGNIYIALIKVDPEAAPIELPFKCCQMIIRPQYQTIFEECTDLLDTHRGDGGFGSTDDTPSVKNTVVRKNSSESNSSQDTHDGIYI